MTNLVLGASGQVGWSLWSRVGGVGTGHRHPQPGMVSLDLRDAAGLRELLRAARPDVCYLPGAWTHVDGAEEQPQDCRAVNVEAVTVAAHELANLGGVLVLFSTDHVFPERATLWHEDEPVAPASVYARSKAEAEAVVRDVLPERHLIVRTSWVFGPDPQAKNFACRVRATLERGETLTVPSDQWGQPTFGPDLAAATCELVQRGATGTYHVVGPRWLDRLTWATLIAKAMGLDASRIEGRTTAELGSIAPRPLRVGLDRSNLVTTLGYDPIRDPAAGIRLGL
jgi:dTDP-4-dehydrorhamnose reductase